MRVGEVAERAGVNVETLPISPAAAARRPRGRRSSTSPTAKAPATRCGRPRSAAPCCPGRTCSTRGRCRRCHGRSCCGHAPASSPTAAGVAEQALLSSLERRDRQLLEALRDGLQVVLWFEHDLYDQLQLLDVLALAHAEGAAPELIVIGSFPGKPSFAGLGELTASELETLWPSRRRAAPASASGGGERLGRRPGAGADDTRRVGHARDRAAAVSRPRAAAVARGAARAGGRALADGTICAPGGRRRRPHTSGRFRCRATTRGGSVPRRRLVLPSALGARAGKDEAPRNRRRRATSSAASARRRPALRTTPAAADGNRRTHAARRSRPSRAPRHRPLDRRHPHHVRQHVALGPRRTEARSTLSTLVPPREKGRRSAPFTVPDVPAATRTRATSCALPPSWSCSSCSLSRAAGRSRGRAPGHPGRDRARRRRARRRSRGTWRRRSGP